MIDVKICGLRPGDDLSFAVHKAITHTGIVFAKRSRRYVTPDDARVLSDGLRDQTKVMGVFVDTQFDEMVKIAATAHLDGVQLHGNESSELCQSLRAEGLLVWKAFSVPRNRDEIASFSRKLLVYQDSVDALLLDAPPPKDANSQLTGGHGQAFDWRELALLTQELTNPRPPVWVAGGITPENVGLLLNTYAPAGIDVSSGVEVSGRKSTERIYALMEAVNQYAG